MSETLKILVVDDDEVDRMAVRRSLGKASINAEVTEAMDAREAIAILTDNVFDCLLLDYRLPDKDGLELIQQVRQIGMKIPTIVFTGQGDEQIAVELMKAGASDYVSKSRVSPETLDQTIRNAIRIHHAELEAQIANEQLRESHKLLLWKNQQLEQQRQQIELQNQKLLEVSRLKSQFLASMSHELRTPMNAIMGFSQMLLRQYPDPLSSPQVDMVKRIFKNAQHLLTMLNEVLDFSKIEAGRFEVKLEGFDLGKFATMRTEELRCFAVEKDLRLEVNVQLENPEIVNDPGGMRRVLVNLISNAIKFTESGYVRIDLWELGRDRVAIAVKDTGVGIAKENLQHIFEAFRQVDQTFTRKYSGTGLGLAIVKSLVEMMEGTITVESELGKGSTFQVELPRFIGKQKETYHTQSVNCY